MSASNADTVVIYRASIVGAVKRSSVLMADLVRQVRAGWPHQEAHAGGQGALALQQLAKNESRLVAQYPLAMLELFAQGSSAQPGAVSVTGKLVEIGKDDVRLRVEMVRARQRIAHEAAPALSELDTLIGAAQGFDRVQPERNPLRPGNYVRALFGVVYGVGVPHEVARLWLAPMQEALGGLLAREYRRVSEELRARSVQPLHYLAAAGRSRFAGLAGDESPRSDAVESFLSPLGHEALPGLDSSMWDSLRSAATLGSSAVADDFAPTTPGPVRGSSATVRQPLAVRAAPVVTRQEPMSITSGLRAPSAHAPLDVSAPSDSQEPHAADTGAPPAFVSRVEEGHPPLEDSVDASLNVGDWVSIEGAHGVVRTQLTWLSPRRTLFLFTQADGSTQSMTSRMVARQLQSGAIKRISA